MKIWKMTGTMRRTTTTTTTTNAYYSFRALFFALFRQFSDHLRVACDVNRFIRFSVATSYFTFVSFAYISYHFHFTMRAIGTSWQTAFSLLFPLYIWIFSMVFLNRFFSFVFCNFQINSHPEICINNQHKKMPFKSFKRINGIILHR